MTCAMSYVLNVEAVILRIAERCIHRVNNEVLTAFVTEPNEQFHCMTGWQICPTRNMITCSEATYVHCGSKKRANFGGL